MGCSFKAWKPWRRRWGVFPLTCIHTYIYIYANYSVYDSPHSFISINIYIDSMHMYIYIYRFKYVCIRSISMCLSLCLPFSLVNLSTDLSIHPFIHLSSNFPVGLPPLKKTSIKKKYQKGTPPYGFWLFLAFGQANGKITTCIHLPVPMPETKTFICLHFEKITMCKFILIPIFLYQLHVFCSI